MCLQHLFPASSCLSFLPGFNPRLSFSLAYAELCPIGQCSLCLVVLFFFCLVNAQSSHPLVTLPNLPHAIKKCHGQRGFNNISDLSPSPGGWESGIKVLARLAPSEGRICSGPLFVACEPSSPSVSSHHLPLCVSVSVPKFLISLRTLVILY